MSAPWFSFCTKFLNFYTLFGAVLFVLTSYALIDDLSTVNRTSFLSFSRDCGSTTGQISNIEKTKFSEGGEFNHYPIFQVEYLYKVDDREYVSYGYASTFKQHVGDTIFVRYKLSDPTLSKADFFRTSIRGPFVLFGILLPICGLLIIIKGIKWGNRFISLMADGIITIGQYISSCESGEDFKHYYRYYDLQGKNHRISTVNTDKVAKQNVKILFSKKYPGKAEVISLSTTPIIFGRGKIRNLLREESGK